MHETHTSSIYGEITIDKVTEKEAESVWPLP